MCAHRQADEVDSGFDRFIQRTVEGGDHKPGRCEDPDASNGEEEGNRGFPFSEQLICLLMPMLLTRLLWCFPLVRTQFQQTRALSQALLAFMIHLAGGLQPDGSILLS